jgi:uncharacterized membrane protein
MSKRSLDGVIGANGIAKIERAVAAVERTTSAEIAVFVREWSSHPALFLVGDMNRRVRRKAETLFIRNGLDRTAGRNAIMLYVSLREHVAVVLGDSAINARVDERTWRAVVALLADAAKQGRLVDGICQAVDACGAVLAEHFPRRPDDRNEITNQPNVA